MRRPTLATLATLTLLALAGGCEETDVPETGGEVAPGEELEDREREVEPVDLEAQPWFEDGGTVNFQDKRWLLHEGPTVFDPAVEYVGEYQGTPLYAEVNVTGPYSRLYIPLENDYWQILEPAGGAIPVPDSIPAAAEVDTAIGPGG